MGFKSGKSIGRTQKILDFNKRIEEIMDYKSITMSCRKFTGMLKLRWWKNAYMSITAKAESLMPIYDELAETQKMIGINRER